MAEDVAERLWAAAERAQAEAALCESEERFRQFAASSADLLWIRDAGPLAMEYVSPAIQTIYGVRSEAILAMIRSVADQTGETVSDVEDYRDLLEGRLWALARVQALLTQAANAGVDLATLIRAEVDAQATNAGQWALSGPELVLSPKAGEVLTLAVHELATNALKYGAFSHAAGQRAVTWRVFYPTEEPWLRLDWVETGVQLPVAPYSAKDSEPVLSAVRDPTKSWARATSSWRRRVRDVDWSSRSGAATASWKLMLSH